MSNITTCLYEVLVIKKGNKKRTIYCPTNEYKQLLRTFIPKLHEIYLRNRVFDCDHAFLKGKNCVTNASCHILNRYVLSLDIESFFESVTEEMLVKFVEQSFLNFMLVDKKAVQGFPTSPYLANIAMIEVDFLIVQMLRQVDPTIIYSRYADDLTISFNNVSVRDIIQKNIEAILNNAQLKLNKQKTILWDKEQGRAIITGIGVSYKDIHPTRKSLKKLRAALHQQNYFSSQGLKEWVKCKYPKR